MLTEAIPNKFPLREATQQRNFKGTGMLPLQSQVLWKIEYGIVRTCAYYEEGTRSILGYWGKGEVVGSPFSGLSPYGIECLTDVRVSMLLKSSWSQVIDDIISHTRQMEELLYISGYERTSQRLLHFLVWLAKKFGQTVQGGMLINIPLTHESIADSVASTRVTITRLLRQFEREGIIHRQSRSIVLANNVLN
jgi:CRP-like cAMP-binding protein